MAARRTCHHAQASAKASAEASGDRVAKFLQPEYAKNIFFLCLYYSAFYLLVVKNRLHSSANTFCYIIILNIIVLKGVQQLSNPYAERKYLCQASH